MGRTPELEIGGRKVGACTLGFYLAQVDPCLDSLRRDCVDMGNGSGNAE